MDNMKGNDCSPFVTQMEDSRSDCESIGLALTAKGKQPENDSRNFLPEKPFMPEPMRINCKKCNAPIWTEVKKYNSMATYLFCFLICFTGLGACCCCFIPCCMDRCKVVQHTCSNCKNYLGEYYPK